MRFILDSSLLISLALSISAMPYEQEVVSSLDSEIKLTDEIVIPRFSKAGLYLCDSAGFVGHCVHYTTPFDQCGEFIDRRQPYNMHTYSSYN